MEVLILSIEFHYCSWGSLNLPAALTIVAHCSLTKTLAQGREQLRQCGILNQNPITHQGRKKYFRKNKLSSVIKKKSIHLLYISEDLYMSWIFLLVALKDKVDSIIPTLLMWKLRLRTFKCFVFAHMSSSVKEPEFKLKSIL